MYCDKSISVSDDPHHLAVAFLLRFAVADGKRSRIADRHHELFEAAVAGHADFPFDPEIEGQQVALLVQHDLYIGFSPMDFRSFESFEKAIADFEIESVCPDTQRLMGYGTFCKRTHPMLKQTAKVYNLNVIAKPSVNNRVSYPC